MQFKNWKISNEDDLLTDETKKHLENFKIEEKEKDQKKKKKPNDVKSSNNLMSKSVIVPKNTMEKWARVDYQPEMEKAKIIKQQFDENSKIDSLQKELRGFLNVITIDNYEDIKGKILEKIRDNVEEQGKFLDTLFQKAVFENAYSKIYAKLVKDLDKDLPQKTPGKEKDGKKKQTSIMRSLLVEKCKIIFTIQNVEKFNDYIKKESEDRETKLRQFFIGNINFINQLIENQILSKRIVPGCINNLFARYKEGDELFKQINLEAIIKFTDRFGTLIHNKTKKKTTEEGKNFLKFLDEVFEKLEKIKDEPGLVGKIKYLIINLIEKRKNNYQQSNFEKSIIAKSKKEVEKEKENEGQITQDSINEKMGKELANYKDFVKEEGNSKDYQWTETTYLYEKKGTGLDDILEGYIDACSWFIEKDENIKYAKDFIKELIEYYGNKAGKKGKKDLKNKLFKLFEAVKDLAIELPNIYDIYAFIIYIFLENDIIEISELFEIMKNDSDVDDIKIISNVFSKVDDYYNKKEFKEEISKFIFVKNNKEIFDWMTK